jgi:hypothetical protein
MQQISAWQKVVRVLVAAAFLAGCGGVAVRPSASTTGDLLRQSGFRMEAAKNPDHLERVPGYQFFNLEKDGKTIYVYADLKAGNLYFGSDKAYYRYKAQAARAGVQEAPQAPPSERPTLSAADWDLYASVQGVDP